MLHKSQVIFDPEAHTYTLNGVLLSGITGLIQEKIFPDKYKDIPKHILDEAARRGTYIHEQCELIDEGAFPSTIEGVKYVENCKAYGLTHVESEYLVSDEENYASCIDKVMKGEGYEENEFDLGDIKTTSKLDKEYVSWQLSIYAYLFELNNPDCKVKRLFAMWLRGEKSEFAEVERKPVEEVKRLLECGITGEPFMTQGLSVIPETYLAMQDAIVELDNLAKEYEDRRKALLAEVKDKMESANVKKWEMDKLMFTIKPDTERESFDSKAFAKDHPDLYERYKKTSKVKGSILLTIKKNAV